jgi:hypothetical protein
MVSRRRVLRRLIPASVGVGVAGCTRDTGEPAPHSVGESVTHRGLRLAVTRTETARELTTADGSSRGDRRGLITPDRGAVFALAYLRVTNVGEIERAVPGRRSHVNILYAGSETTDRLVTGPLGGGAITRQQVYSDSMAAQAAAAGAPPGTVVDGWTVFELPERFERSDTVVSVRDGETSAEGRRFRWRFGG